MAARIFLALSALIWLPYGLWCFADPGFLAGAAGVGFTSATGSTELRAMYGGLQAAIGALALGGVLREALRRTALVTLAFLCAGLALSRLAGLALDGALSSYTASALAFEIPSAALAAFLVSRASALAARP